jgi:hypothetical protein
MTFFARMRLLALAGLVAAGCGASPTAPTPIATTEGTPAPVPAPVSQTLTGTWSSGRHRFTVTQIGTAATGMTVPYRTELEGPITVVETGIISGAVSGDNVTLDIDDRYAVSGEGLSTTCRAGHRFIATLSGSTLSGILVAGTTAFTCDSDAPPIPMPTLSQPMTFTRQ